MSRGLIIVLSGFLPLVLAIAVDSFLDRHSGPIVAGLALLSMVVLFVLGTTVTATDKGHSVGTGLLLGLIAPLGTVFAVLLRDQREVALAESRADSLAPATSQSSGGTAGFDSFMVCMDYVTCLASLAVGLLVTISFSWYLLAGKGGIAVGKVIIGVSSGAMYGAATAGALVFWPLVFAPGQWLLTTERGRLWLQRTGLKNQENTVALRIMSFFIATFCTGVLFVLCMAVIDTWVKARAN